MLEICTGKLRQKDDKFKASLSCMVTKTNMAGEVAPKAEVLALTSLVT